MSFKSGGPEASERETIAVWEKSVRVGCVENGGTLGRESESLTCQTDGEGGIGDGT